jgi:antitoxin ParD1/3/4
VEIVIDARNRRYAASKVHSGQFKSPSDVVKYALNRLKRDERDLATLKREIQKGIDSLERGEATPWDVEEAKAKLLRRYRRHRSKG